ncbi:MAG: hypothetical protein CVV44_20110 [Spirochaetae bacterium HGW-Spirochaetae-1]|jgi:DNA-binding PadR family transcriptional regulator|nr:MAG: hypothetical protein CVV44_20110 [Spirochaetae bacterium HGW-Spirochaetae-1]
MSVKHLIMGALIQNPDYGYNMRNRFFSRILTEFGLNDGQLYPALKQMEADELIEKEIEYQDSGPNRHKYHITEKGRREFFAWLESSEGEERAYRYEAIRSDPFLNRCIYLNHLEKTKAVEKIERQIALVEDTVLDFRKALENMTARKLDRIKIKIVEYSLRNQETRLQWLRELHDEINKQG